SFTNYFVSDSLCCPSRSTILRGQYIHNHQVLGNVPPAGGFEKFHNVGNENSDIATWLHKAGYRTGLFGKYLNGYPNTVSANYIPPGWDDWVSPNGGDQYSEYDYSLNVNGSTEEHAHETSDYLVDVLASQMVHFVRTNAGHPFFAYV